MTARASRRIAFTTGLVYLFAYLYVLGDLAFGGAAGWNILVADEWHIRGLQPRSLFQFEGIAMLQAGAVTFIVSPLNLLIAILLAALVAANVHGVFELRRAPPACAVPGARTGLLVPVPALLAGGACCAPALLLLIGVPGLGALAGLFGWLIPLSLVLLLASRWWQRRLGAPPFGLQVRKLPAVMSRNARSDLARGPWRDRGRGRRVRPMR